MTGKLHALPALLLTAYHFLQDLTDPVGLLVMTSLSCD